MGRSGARVLDQESTSSSNLDALLSMGNLNSNAFGVERSSNSSSSGSSSRSGTTNSGGTTVAAPSPSNSLSEAAKRANLMHNMRRIERIELLTNKRKDR